MHQPIEAFRVERVGFGQPLAKLRQQSRGLRVLPQPLVEGLVVVFELVVGCEKPGVVEDVARNLDPVGGGRDDLENALAHLAAGARVDQPGLFQVRHDQVDLRIDRHAEHVAFLERRELLRIEAGRRLVHPVERKRLDQVFAAEMLRPVVEGPAQQGQVVDDRLGQVAHSLVKIHDHRVEGIALDRQADRRGDLLTVLEQLGEIAVLQVFVELALAQLDLAARLGDERQVGVLGQCVAQALGDEDLPRRIREVLFGPDHVRNPHRVVVDHAR